MLVTLQFAIQVLKLRRQNATVAQMAVALGRSEAEILDAHCMLGIAIADQDDDPTLLDTANRAAARANWPMKWQQRYEKGKR